MKTKTEKDKTIIQLARFITEAEMAGLFSESALEEMALSMDLTIEQLSNDIELAQKIYDSKVENIWNK